MDKSDFSFGRVLGDGSFSTVYYAKEIKTEREVAVKVLSKAQIIREKKNKYVYREKEALLKVKNPFIIKLYSTFQDHDNLYFVLEYAPNRELLKLLNKQKMFSLPLAQFFSAEIVLALQCLHSNRIIHRDLKPENLLLNKNNHILITDFGCAKIIEDDEEMDFIKNFKPTKPNKEENNLDIEEENEEEKEEEKEEEEKKKNYEDKKQEEMKKENKNQDKDKKVDNNNNTNLSKTNNIKPTTNDSSSTTTHTTNCSITTTTTTTTTNTTINTTSTTTSTNNNSNHYNKHKILSNNNNVKRVRKHSFVGTAQYVSPEVLDYSFSCFGSDLWALGCIIYQFLTGSFAFHACSEYLVFQKVLRLNYTIPSDLDLQAKDLIQNLIVLDWNKRLGCEKMGGYEKLKLHPFFSSIQWEELYNMDPPISGLNSDNHSNTTSLSVNDCHSSTDKRDIIDYMQQFHLPDDIDFIPLIDNREELLEKQRSGNEYNKFVEGNLILKQGLLDKKVRMRARRRMFLLTEGPHLYYVDPVAMVLKGQIPWTKELKPEMKSFKTFFIHTPGRVYYLEDPEDEASKWFNKINEVHKQYFS